MKSKALIATAVALTLSMSSLSTFAQGMNSRDNQREQVFKKPQQRHDSRTDQRADRRDDRQDNRFDRRHDRRDDRRDTRQDRYERRYYYNARSPDFRRGAYIPREYRNRQYVVVNYRVHHLAPPPRGHQWVQVGADYVLIAIATGIIASIILSH